MGVVPFEGRRSSQLRGKALLPGFVNAHSHAFQFGLRGLGESYPEGAGDFWTWRQAMYSLVDSLDEETCYELSLAAFREMRRNGITTAKDCSGENNVTSSNDQECDQKRRREPESCEWCADGFDGRCLRGRTPGIGTVS